MLDNVVHGHDDDHGSALRDATYSLLSLDVLNYFPSKALSGIENCLAVPPSARAILLRNENIRTISLTMTPHITMPTRYVTISGRIYIG